MTLAHNAVSAALAIAVDRMVGEPPNALHPVVGFGTIMGHVERRLWADNTARGVLHSVIGVAIGSAAGTLTQRGVRRGAVTVAATFAIGGRALDRAARDVGDALMNGDLAGARQALPSLVGRDPSALDASELARAVIESVAENTVDAVTAPALWATVLGAPGASAYRSINTMDAMVGHRSERYRHYGTAAALLDDVVNFVPARLTALLVVAVRPRSARAVIHAVRTQAPAHPSPNSGVVEAAFAAALGLRLGGESRYGTRVEIRPELGTGRIPMPTDIDAARTLARDVDVACAVALGSTAMSAALLGRWWNR